MDKSNKDDYKVGRGKPPKEHQYKPGQSGNPKGRPKKQHYAPTTRMLREQLFLIGHRKLTVSENGRSKTITYFEALMQAIFKKAINGSVYAQRYLFSLLDEKAQEHADEQMRLIELLFQKEEALEDAFLKGELENREPQPYFEKDEDYWKERVAEMRKRKDGAE
ncbi:MAG: DUF5681 domain-containing protein [Pseudomonadota bacterium]